MTAHGSGGDPPEFNGAALRAARKRRGLFQAQLCAQSGVSIHTLRGYEQGRDTNPTADTLARLAHALECPITEFFRTPVPAEIAS